MVEIQLSNEALSSAPDVTPKLIAQIQYIDEVWREIGWSKTLTGMDISTGFNRSLTIPLDELANGKKYERIRPWMQFDQIVMQDEEAFQQSQNESQFFDDFLVFSKRTLYQNKTTAVLNNCDYQFNHSK